MKPFTTVAVALLSLVCVGHALRLCMGWEAVINGWRVPIWLSAAGTLVAGFLAVMVRRESRRR